MLRDTGTTRVMAPPAGGADDEALLRAVRQAAAADFDVLGETDSTMSGVGGTAATGPSAAWAGDAQRSYVARDRRTGRLVTLRLERDDAGFKLIVAGPGEDAPRPAAAGGVPPLALGSLASSRPVSPPTASPFRSPPHPTSPLSPSPSPVPQPPASLAPVPPSSSPLRPLGMPADADVEPGAPFSGAPLSGAPLSGAPLPGAQSPGAQSPGAHALRVQPTPRRGGAQEVLLPTDQAPLDEILPPRPPWRPTGRMIAGAASAAVVVVALGVVSYIDAHRPDATAAPGEMTSASAPAASAAASAVGATAVRGAAASTGAVAPPAAPDSGHVEIASGLPAGARVTVNGRPISARSVALVPGTYALAASAPGYIAVSDDLHVDAGKTVDWAPAMVAIPTAAPAFRTAAGPRAPAELRDTPARRTASTGKARGGASRGGAAHPAAAPSAPATSSPSAAATPTCVASFAAKDWSAALALCTRDAQAGDATADRDLGAMYEQGHGIPADPAQAVGWYRKAADAGNRDAAARLGAMYAAGRGAPKDLGEAMAWYQRAAAMGDPDAQLAVAKAYENGTGVAKSLRDAASWYRKAAEQGNVEAENYLGWIYGTGRGLSRDDTAAVRWFRAAAEAGDAQAEFNLGFMYANGRGVPRDDAQAVVWYRKAARQHHADAIEQLHRRGLVP